MVDCYGAKFRVDRQTGKDNGPAGRGRGEWSLLLWELALGVASDTRFTWLDGDHLPAGPPCSGPPVPGRWAGPAAQDGRWGWLLAARCNKAMRWGQSQQHTDHRAAPARICRHSCFCASPAASVCHSPWRALLRATHTRRLALAPALQRGEGLAAMGSHPGGELECQSPWQPERHAPQANGRDFASHPAFIFRETIVSREATGGHILLRRVLGAMWPLGGRCWQLSFLTFPRRRPLHGYGCSLNKEL